MFRCSFRVMRWGCSFPCRLIQSYAIRGFNIFNWPAHTTFTSSHYEPLNRVFSSFSLTQFPPLECVQVFLPRLSLFCFSFFLSLSNVYRFMMTIFKDLYCSSFKLVWRIFFIALIHHFVILLFGVFSQSFKHYAFKLHKHYAPKLFSFTIC